MEQRNCKNCKYYNPKHTFYKNYGNCECKKMIYGDTLFANEKSKLFVEKKKDFLIYDDAEGYAAYIHVGEEFGCIYWEKNK